MIDKLVACLDDSPSASAVCDWTAWLSKGLNSDAVLLHVLEKAKNVESQDFSGSLGFDSRENLLAELVDLDAKRAKIELAQGKILLEHALARVSANTDKQIDTLQRHDELLPAIQAQLTEESLLVIGRQGTSGDELGSHIDRITRKVAQPILVTTTNAFTEPKKIMLAYDGKETAKNALKFISHCPLFETLEVHVVMIGEYSQDELNMPAMMFIEAGKKADVKRYPTPQNDKALTDILLEHAQTHSIDLLAIGAYGHSALRRLFLGSTTLDTLQRAHIPVLLLR